MEHVLRLRRQTCRPVHHLYLFHSSPRFYTEYFFNSRFLYMSVLQVRGVRQFVCEQQCDATTTDTITYIYYQFYSAAKFFNTSSLYTSLVSQLRVSGRIYLEKMNRPRHSSYINLPHLQPCTVDKVSRVNSETRSLTLQQMLVFVPEMHQRLQVKALTVTDSHSQAKKKHFWFAALPVALTCN